MKLGKIKIRWIALAVTLLVGVFFAVRMNAKSAAQQEWLTYCEAYGIPINPDSIYANFELSTEDMIELYHETMNTKFNEYIKKMITTEGASPGHKNGLSPEKEEDCTAENYSTFCVARDLLTNPNYGLMTYKKSLTCRRYQFFDSEKEIPNFTTDTSVPWASEEAKKKAKSIYQAEKIMEISTRLEALEREDANAKQALDQTLAAYTELRTAWPMHKKYMKIYESLLQYRDKFVEIRNQIEDFPRKFIDATTTKCT